MNWPTKSEREKRGACLAVCLLTFPYSLFFVFAFVCVTMVV
jgi:hypothetical protein